MRLEDWDKETLERGLIALFHYANGLKHARTKPLAKSNKDRVSTEADAVAYVAAWAEWNMREIGL